MTDRPTLVFDLDGTLCQCGIYYVQALDEFVHFQVKRTGLPEPVVDQIDLAATKLPDAFNRDRFPRSFFAASLALDALVATPLMPLQVEHVTLEEGQAVPVRREIGGLEAVDLVAARESFRLADKVFEAPYDLFPGIKETLYLYGSQGWQILLLTKGDKAVQERKIRINGLDPFFHGVVVTPEKSAELLNWYLTESYADRSRTWVIGDSMRDDMGPALELGIGTIHITAGASTWAYDNEKHTPTAALTAVPEMGQVVALDPTHPRAYHGAEERQVVAAV